MISAAHEQQCKCVIVSNNNNNNDNNNIYLLQLGCHPVAGVILHEIGCY